MAKTPIPETAPLEFIQSSQNKFLALIAIPCCNEYQTLPSVIKSLEKNQPELVSQTLVTVNVNNRSNADNTDNLKTLEWIKSYDGPIKLAFLNSSECPFSFPEKFGVGLARHQAIMSSIEYIDSSSAVISLDGDSPVSANYLEAIFEYTEKNPSFGAGHVNFKHKHDGTAEEIYAIQLYDQHLHRHRKNLEESGSPHAWYAIGSTIVCTKEAYLKAGGYNARRMAGEDFYLLQQLSKVGFKIEMIENAFVYPSNRESDRVPFGTGKAVSDILKSGEWLTYHTDCYKTLKKTLEIIYSKTSLNGLEILNCLPQESKDWFLERKFPTVWEKLKANSKSSEALIQRFNEWLDAFQTLKFIHFLSDKYFPRVKTEL